MKALYTMFFILITHLSTAQYGQEGAILAVGEGVARALELDQLNKIAKLQDGIVAYQGTIVLATADIVRVEQIKLDSQKDVSSWVSNLSSVIQITNKANTLLELQIAVVDLASEQPEYLPFITESMINIINDSRVIAQDFQIALKESNTNLLSAKKRIDVLNISNDGLDHLITKSVKLYKFMESLNTLLQLDIDQSQFTYDFRNAIEQNEQIIEQLIIE